MVTLESAAQYLQALGYSTVKTGPPVDLYVESTLGLKLGAIPTREELRGIPVGLGFFEDHVAMVTYLNTKPEQALALNDWIRLKRLALEQTNPSFSLRKVADRVGISPSYLSKIERGEKEPSEEVVRYLAADLRLSLEEAQLRCHKVPSSMFLQPRRTAAFLRALNEPYEAVEFLKGNR